MVLPSLIYLAEPKALYAFSYFSSRATPVRRYPDKPKPNPLSHLRGTKKYSHEKQKPLHLTKQSKIAYTA